MKPVVDPPQRDRWARLRFSIIGPLLAAPPPAGELQAALKSLAAKSWRHPLTAKEIGFGVSTLERWYYTAKSAADPVAALRNHLRDDVGRFPSLAPRVIEVLVAESLVHGLSQAFMKRGLPRALMTDNGAAMLADETVTGLATLGIVHQTTLPYSPYQNAKQESFWGRVEGRLMAMLEGEASVTLDLLNQATQAWVEQEYHRTRHSEIGATPLARYLAGPNVRRDCPTAADLAAAFRIEVARRQRRSDGTVSLAGARFEIPAAYRHLVQVHLHYARWDLTRVDLVDARTGQILSPLRPLDKSANADGQRRALTPIASRVTGSVPTPSAEFAGGFLSGVGRYLCRAAQTP